MRSPRTSTLVLSTALLLVSVVGCNDTSGDFSESLDPDIAVNRYALSFPEVGIGASSDQVLEIRNLGEGRLRIPDMYITGEDAPVFEIFVAPDVVYGHQPLELAPLEEDGDTREILVRFAPKGVGKADATLNIPSNDPDEPLLEIDLTSLENGPRPQVVPNPVVFGLVDGGETTFRDVRIVNVGSAPLRFQKIWLTGSTDFSVEEAESDDIPFPEAPLEPGEGFERRVIYAPPTLGPDFAQLHVEYWFHEGETRIYSADISANGAEPCIRLTPQDVVDFGQALVGETHEIAVAIENCGSQDLTVSSIALDEGTPEAFLVTNLPTELENGDPYVLSTDEIGHFSVLFSPIAEGPYEGGLTITSDAPARPEINLDLRGIGTINNCPMAVAGGRVLNSGNPFQDTVAAEPLQYLELDASGSVDPDGQAVTGFEWSVVAAPPGFSVGFEPTNTAAKPRIQLALVGDYVFELIVFDERGRPSCNAARVDVRARTDRDLVVELTWRTPSDFDETDASGTDLDLHMLRAGGTWNEAGSGDCNYQDPDPLWGSYATTDDDPHLDRDDVNGGGPEQINIQRPAFTDGNPYSAPYQIGVYFFDDHDFAPPALATVKIYMNGDATPTHTLPSNANNEMRMSEADPSLWQSGHFWLVGSLDWDANGGTFYENTASSPRYGFPW